MAKKKIQETAEKTEQTAIANRPVDGMNIYNCQVVINEMNALAEQNGGELTDEQLEALVASKTTSIELLGSLVGAIKYYEAGITFAESEIKRISEIAGKANNRLENIKKYLTPFVKERVKVQVGTVTLTTRKSVAVEIVSPDFDDPFFSKITSIKNPSDALIAAARATDKPDENIIQSQPDKKAIKEALEADPLGVPGCRLIERDNLQIK